MAAAQSSSIVADGFCRAAFPRFFSQSDFFRSHWLTMNVAIASIVLTSENVRSNFRTESTVNAGGIVIVGAGNVFRHFVMRVGHLMILCWFDVVSISWLPFRQKFISLMV
jgi:hypothetical protein